MPLPTNFNSFEFLQDTVRKIFLDEVREEFLDVTSDIEDDIRVPRSALKTACTPKDDDTCEMLMLRMLLFYLSLRKAQDLQTPIYGMPIGTWQEIYYQMPTVHLYFREDLEDVDPDYYPIDAQISYRIVDRKIQQISITDLETLARKIKSEFGINNGYRWKKGKILNSYKNKEDGYNLRIATFDKSTAKEIIEKVLSLENKQPNWQYWQMSEADNSSLTFPTIPPTTTILGKIKRLPRRRPVGFVRFTHATFSAYGISKPIVLYSRVLSRRKTLID